MRTFSGAFFVLATLLGGECGWHDLNHHGPHELNVCFLVSITMARSQIRSLSWSGYRSPEFFSTSCCGTSSNQVSCLCPCSVYSEGRSVQHVIESPLEFLIVFLLQLMTTGLVTSLSAVMLACVCGRRRIKRDYGIYVMVACTNLRFAITSVALHAFECL
jgi:hypothetical protein